MSVAAHWTKVVSKTIPTSRHFNWQAGSIDGTERFDSDDHCKALGAWVTDSKQSVADAA